MNNVINKKVNLASQPKNGNLRSGDFAQKIILLADVIASKLKTINGLVFRNKGRGLIKLTLRLIRGVHPRSSKSVVRQVVRFAFKCNHLALHSGLKGLVIYLKACQVLLQQVVGGYRVLDLSELKVRPSRNRVGLPLIIPAGVRVQISRDRNIKLIKLWMTLFGLYRILEFRGKLNLSTIIDNGPDISSFIPEWESFLRTSFKPNLLNLSSFPDLNTARLFPIIKSGPSTYSICGASSGFVNSSSYALILAARAWLRIGAKDSMLDSLKVFLPNFPAGNTILHRMQAVSLASHPALDQRNNTMIQEQYLGRLGFKKEPAGKVRVFAMVDAWTQWIMSPLHEWIFGILPKIPQDGTFDQLSPIERLQELYGDKPKGSFGSIDLSAATDRLPIAIQVSLLKILFEDILPDSASFAQSWADLLVKRRYEVPLNDQLESQFEVPNGTPQEVIYSVGQPMGALSSWAMLALTHHAIMQFSAYRAGFRKGWFSDYAVLGDDGVIKGAHVIREYRAILQILGVQAGLAKSILSKGKFVVEFAKKFFVDKTTANMLPWKEVVATWASTSLVVELVRKYDMSLNSILSLMGYGYKAKSWVHQVSFFKLSTRLRVLIVWLTHPSSPLGKELYVDWLFQHSLHEDHYPHSEAIAHVLKILEQLVHQKFQSIWEANRTYISTVKDIDKVLDKQVPISITSTVHRDEAVSFKTNLPWKAVLSPSVTEGQIDLEYLSGWTGGGMSHHGYRFSSLKDLNLGMDIDDNLDQFYAEVLELENSIPEMSPEFMRIEELCIHYFKLDDLKAQIPEKFWPEVRLGKFDKSFRDFLLIYKFWQDVTKPIWADFYGKEFVPEQTKPNTPKPSPERGSIEDLVQSSPPFWNLKIRSLIEFVFGIVLAFGLLQSLYDPPILITIELLESSDPVSLLSDVEPEAGGWWSELKPSDKSAIILGGMGISILITNLLILWISGTPLSVAFPWYPWINTEVPSTEIDGPLSLDQLGFLQIQLENRALLDNLAISPIGDLWIDPW